MRDSVDNIVSEDADSQHVTDSLEPVQQEPPRQPINLLQLIAGILVVVAGFGWFGLLVDRVIMPLIVLRGVEIVVPDLHYIPLTTADSLCSQLGIELVRGRSRIDDQVPEGYVVDQFPVSGVSVKPGRRVEVVLSASPEVILCPDFNGRSAREAALVADSAGLILDELLTRYRYSQHHPSGVVVDQRPEPMTSLLHGDTVSISISLGAEPTEIVAPSLLGLQLAEVNILLMQHKVQLGKIVRFPDKSVLPNTIISQSPSPGTPMETDGKIDVQVAVKPKSDDNP